MNYIHQAQSRAKRRKSPWNLLLIPVCFVSWGALAFAMLRANEFLHEFIYAGETLGVHSNSFAVLLATIPILPASIPLGLVVGNFAVWLIPSVRIILDKEAKPFPEASFLISQRDLLIMSAYVMPPCIILAVIGALIPW